MTSLGGSACGDPEEAATTATVAHAITPKGEQVAGLVPDDVKTVRINTTGGRKIDVEVRDNIFAAWLPSPEETSAVLWVMQDGSIEQKVP